MNVIDDAALQKVLDEAIDRLEVAAQKLVDSIIQKLDTLGSAKIAEIRLASVGTMTDAQSIIKPVLAETQALRAELAAWRQLLAGGVVLKPQA